MNLTTAFSKNLTWSNHTCTGLYRDRPPPLRGLYRDRQVHWYSPSVQPCRWGFRAAPFKFNATAAGLSSYSVGGDSEGGAVNLNHQTRLLVLRHRDHPRLWWGEVDSESRRVAFTDNWYPPGY